MREMILLKLGEIALKGLNRRSFEEIMMKNIRRRLAGAGEFSVTSKQSTIYVEPLDDNADMDLAEERCAKVFGAVGYTRAGAAEKELGKIQEKAAEYLRDELETASTFKVEAKRSDKKFPMKSPEIAMEVGAYLLDKYPHLRVDVHHPDVTVWVEVREEHAFVHADAKPGAGGIPVGCGGKAAVLISGGLDSPVAAWLAMKRGVTVEAVHFESFPFTSERAQEKVLDLARELARWQNGQLKVHCIHFTEIQKAIHAACPEEYGITIMRRFMFRLAERVARSSAGLAIYTGESVGQVASQTLESMYVINEVTRMPVLRPLVGFDKEEIMARAKQLGTYETSIRPYEDCCTVFLPAHPKIKPRLAEAQAMEEKLPIKQLMDEALAASKTWLATPKGVEEI